MHKFGPKVTSRRAFIKDLASTALAGLATSSCSRSKKEKAMVESKSQASDKTKRTVDNREKSIQELLRSQEALFRPTGNGCTVQWVPRGKVEARIYKGDDPGNLTLYREITTAKPAGTIVDGFKPGSEFYLQCQFREPGTKKWKVQPVRHVHTRRKQGETYRVAMIADSHSYSCIGNKMRMDNIAATSRAVIEAEPDFAVFLGDEAGVHFLKDRRGYMNQKRAFKRWESWRTAFAPLLGAVPGFMALGNHEGEAGFYRQLSGGRRKRYLQRWGTIARKRYFLNPLPDTYPEGGENENWTGSTDSPATGGTKQGNRSPLQNYYAWTWGDALFAVLDVHRYTNIGGRAPKSVDEWTLGKAQLGWLEKVLMSSRAKWKVVIAHHLVGGSPWNLTGKTQKTKYVYGRGGARYAMIGEQAAITKIMNRAGARFFMYGHDHVFAHQLAGNIHFICCGRPTYLAPRWWKYPGWKEAYGNADKRNPNDFYAVLGYTRLTISPDSFGIEYIRTCEDPGKSENVDTKVGGSVFSLTVQA